MPSPFPGMDPYIELQEWEDFHQTFNTVLREQLSMQVEPQYIARVEKRVYVEYPPEHDLPDRWADVAVIRPARRSGGFAASSATALATPTRAVAEECEVPMSVERRESFLVIRERDSQEVVTIIETLSPANKRNGDGYREYIRKREMILHSLTHLVEIDLLLTGQRMPTKNIKPSADYFALVSSSDNRPRAQLIHWSVRDPMPCVPIPLRSPDPAVPLDLQAALTTVYDRARYQLSLNYRVERPKSWLAEEDRDWVRQLLEAKS